MLRLSHSSIESFLKCPRHYYLRDVEGIRPVLEHSVLRFGTAFHSALEVWWANQCEMRLTEALNTWVEQCNKLDLYMEDRIIGRLLLIGYDTYYLDRADTMPPASQESRKVSCVYRPDGTIDPELELKVILDNEITKPIHAAMEHKTTRKHVDASSSYWDKVYASQQAELYFLCSSNAGGPLDSIIWDVVRVPTFKRLKATPKDKIEYYKRDCKWGKAGEPKGDVRLTDESWPDYEARVADEIANNPEDYFAYVRLKPDRVALEKGAYDLWSVGRLMLEAHKLQAFPRNRNSCRVGSRECEFRPICFGGVDPAQSADYEIKPPPRPKYLPTVDGVSTGSSRPMEID